MGAGPLRRIQGSGYMCKTVIFPTNAAWVPPPRNQSEQAGENHRWGKDYRVSDVAGTISGNHLVIRL